MATYYVGSGGDNGNDGQSWANRKATLNGAEDTPVAAGDVVYVGPGIYREQLTCDVSGSSGSPITYIADITGAHTDGVGGVVRVTGSDDDQTATRNRCIYASGKDYRTFRGFWLDTASYYCAYCSGGTGWILEDCTLSEAGYYGFYADGAALSGITLRRCVFLANVQHGAAFYHSADVADISALIENCAFFGNLQGHIVTWNMGGITVRNCTLLGSDYGIRIRAALAGGSSVAVTNSLLVSLWTAFYATAAGEIVEDYNNLFANGTDRTNTAAGANSTAYPPLFEPPHLADGGGYKLPWNLGDLSYWSHLARMADDGSTPTVDLYGLARPGTAGKASWGATQQQGAEREASTVRNGSASVKLGDAGSEFLLVPVQAREMTVSVYAYREADYAGTAPQLLIHQPGQSDQSATDTGAAEGWNRLEVTFTPAAGPGWVLVELRSNNTAAAGSYAAYFDDLYVPKAAGIGDFERWLGARQVIPVYARHGAFAIVR
jgi:hypothetical protein